MTGFRCENCGSTHVTKVTDFYICEFCGTMFQSIAETNTEASDGTISIYNGFYKGETLAGKPHGYGIGVYRDGAKYEGNWFAGAYSGKGTYTYADGAKWSGEWKNGEEWNGEGLLVRDDWTYEGTLCNGEMHGQGKIRYNNGDEWEGEWNDGIEWNGKGTVQIYEEGEPTGQVYCGTVVNGELDEKGEWHFHGRINDLYIENDVLIAYYGHGDVVEIPNGVSRVTERCFKWSDMKSIKCPYSLKQFEDTLAECQKLEYFEAPGLSEISTELFSGSKSVQKVVLQNVTCIPERAFADCKALREVVAPNAVKIKKSAFKHSAIVNIVAPKMAEIGTEAFYDCEKLEAAVFPELKIVSRYAFYDCKSIQHVELPKVTKIELGALADCYSLVSIHAPNLEELDISALSYCKRLKTVSFPKLHFIGEKAFSYCDELKEVDCPLAILQPNNQKQYDQFVGCPNLTSIILDGSVNKKRILKEAAPLKRSQGCYIATAVYGSYDCPQVWTLRRYRDYTLSTTWYGRTFIRIYYAISPLLVRWFGHTGWFKKLWKGQLDELVNRLQSHGVESSPYKDKES